jgi:hypothetical protein
MKSDRKIDSYLNLLARLKNLRSSYVKNKAILGILLFLSCAIGISLLGFWLNSVYVFPVVIRVAYLGLGALLLVVVLSYFCLRPIFNKPTVEIIALKVEDKFPELNNRLIAAIQLSKNLKENPEGYSTDMILAVMEQADTTSGRLPLKEIINPQPIKKIGRVTAALAVVFVVFALIFPVAFTSSFYIFSHPLTEFATPQKFNFVISPGNAEVVKYSDLKIKINLEGEKPDNVDLFWKNEGAGWNKEKLSPLSKSTEVKDQRITAGEPDFSYQFKEVKRNFEYYAAAKGVESDHYSIVVVDKPRVVGLKLTFNYPRYTQLKTEVVDENDGSITALGGTKVEVEAKANKELGKADFVFSDSTRQEMEVRGNVASGEILVKDDGSYFIRLEDKNGNTNPDPIEYKITRIEDQSPYVEILEPGQDQDLTENMKLGLVIKISDDYGFSSLKLAYQILSGGNEGEEKTVDIDIPNKNRTTSEVEYQWSLSNFPLLPGDLVRYKAVVYDNDSFSGPKKAESKAYFVRLPSVDEIIAEVEKEQQGQVVDLESVMKGQKELKKKLEDLSQEMNRYTGLDLDWQKKQQLDETLQKQQKLSQDLQKIAQKMDENIKKIEDNKLASLELVEKMMELKKLMDEIATPQMKEAMKKLEDALKNMDPDQLKEAMKQMQVSQEEMLKRLDRTLALLKKMQAEQKLSDLIKSMEQMAEKQDKLNEDIDASSKENLPPLSAEEQKLKDDMNGFEKKLNEFTDQAQELSMLSPQDASELNQMPEESGVKQDMDQAISQLSSSNQGAASKSGKSCSKKLKSMAEKLKGMQQKMQQGEKEEIVRAIRKSLNDVFSLSDNQEQLFDRVSRTDQRDIMVPELAHDQQNIKSGGLRISEDLENLSHATLFVDVDVQRYLALSVASMDQAIQQMIDRKIPIAADEQREALYDLNVTARMLMQSMQNAQKSCNGSGMEQFFQKMQGMCDKQGSCNSETQKLGQCNGGTTPLTLGQQGALQRLAAEQEAIRKALSELASEFGNQSEITGRLDDMGKEMQKVVDDFERMKVDQGTLDRQQKILSRLLDAEKSLKERDYSKQRRAEVGEDVSRPSPGALSPEVTRGEESAKDDLTKYMQESYPKEYEQMIKDYFKALSEEGTKK